MKVTRNMYFPSIFHYVGKHIDPSKARQGVGVVVVVAVVVVVYRGMS